MPRLALLLMGLAAVVPLSLEAQRKAARPAARASAPSGGDAGATAREARALLAASCCGCHGPDKQEAGLRLDERSAALVGGVSGTAIVPGRALDSLVYRRIAGLDGKPQMPMGATKLDAREIAVVRAWIDGGASWAEAGAATGSSRPDKTKHWAYVPPRRPELPAVRDAAWTRNPIDRFILARLEREGLRPQPEASKETLIRRASLDLNGLPPSLAEVDAFAADSSPDAYEKAVDRLLASPHYGERWARPWLDLARYADTNGYEKDDRRRIWPYRDWVIAALNRDMPFDQFTVEQIAGDLLPNASVEQKVATGFHRNTMINEEGGIDLEEYRVAAVLDRVDTTATVWLGSTLGCAQCHDHKFDPFNQEEYYRFFAFFNSSEAEQEQLPGNERRSIGANLTLPVPAHLTSERRTVEEEIARVEAALESSTPELAAAERAWEAQSAALVVPWTHLDPEQVASAAGARIERLEDHSMLAGGRAAERDTYVVLSNVPASGITAIRLEALAHPSLSSGGLSRGTSGTFIVTAVELEAAPSSAPERFAPVRLTDAASAHGSGIRTAIDDDPSTGWTVRPDRMGSERDTQAVFVPEKPFGFDGGTRLRVRIRHESSTTGAVIGRFRLAVISAKEPLRSVRIPVAIQTILARPLEERTRSETARLSSYYRSVAPSLSQMRDRLARLRSLWNELAAPATMVMKELAEPRRSYVHVRGSFLSKGKEVTPGVPAILHPLPAGAPPNRLGLARWLVAPENPLTARVLVNRIWSLYFGRGLVETVEDFGIQGERAAHPELLDWLATELTIRKWSLKALHKLIVTSATYRQRSTVTPELVAHDPANRLLARGPRLRLEAEMVRDSALAVAGLLSPRIGGPSVFPPQPEGIWNLVYNDDKWVESAGDDRYRRGLYTFWRRTAPYPMFQTFDAPSREAICTRRVTTNTPLQSLTTLNDPVFVDAARGLARRIVLEGPAEPRDAAAYGFRIATSRTPDARELDRLVALFQSELDRFRSNEQAARDLVRSGDVRPPDGTDQARFAAWTMVANVLLNLDETLTKG